jgi:hypothetical protein
MFFCHPERSEGSEILRPSLEGLRMTRLEQTNYQGTAISHRMTQIDTDGKRRWDAPQSVFRLCKSVAKSMARRFCGNGAASPEEHQEAVHFVRLLEGREVAGVGHDALLGAGDVLG